MLEKANLWASPEYCWHCAETGKLKFRFVIGKCTKCFFIYFSYATDEDNIGSNSFLKRGQHKPPLFVYYIIFFLKLFL